MQSPCSCRQAVTKKVLLRFERGLEEGGYCYTVFRGRDVRRDNADNASLLICTRAIYRLFLASIRSACSRVHGWQWGHLYVNNGNLDALVTQKLNATQFMREDSNQRPYNYQSPYWKMS